MSRNDYRSWVGKSGLVLECIIVRTNVTAIGNIEVNYCGILNVIVVVWLMVVEVQTIFVEMRKVIVKILYALLVVVEVRIVMVEVRTVSKVV